MSNPVAARSLELNRGRSTATVRRETVQSDDVVEVLFDTFMDGQRAYVFAANPYGIQIDSLWTETGEYDDSFDTLWHSRGRLTPQGLVVWMAIPFRSLRFPTRLEQTWGIQFVRFIPRNNEGDTWPYRSSRIQGRLNQISKGTLQFTRELSLRAILQHDATITNGSLSSATPHKNLNTKLLINPWTELYVGYNSNLENLDPSLTPAGGSLLRTRNRLLDDSRQFFVKFSYLFRF